MNMRDDTASTAAPFVGARAMGRGEVIDGMGKAAGQPPGLAREQARQSRE
jgi:hypothetical protein